MSKFIDSLRSESPASLWVFNQASPTTVTDQGRVGQSLTLTDTGSSATAISSLIPGEPWSVYLPVAAGTNSGHSRYESTTYPEWDKYYTLDKDWTIESVFRTGYSTRSTTGEQENPVWAFLDGTVFGLSLGLVETASGWDLKLKIRIDDNTVSTLITHAVGYGESLHTAVVNVEHNFTLLINGESVGTAEVPQANDVHTATYDTFVVGGLSATNHSNTSGIGAVALMGRAVPFNRIEERYDEFSERKALDELVAGFGPTGVIFPEGEGKAVLAPELDDLFDGADADLEYDYTNDAVSIKPASLAAPFTAYKKMSFDLTDIDTIGRVYHDYTATTGANSSVSAEYSFDDTSYSNLGNGEDVIPEISQSWAQAAEGTL